MAAVRKLIQLEVSESTFGSAKALAMQLRVSVIFRGVWTILTLNDGSEIHMTADWAICMHMRKSLPPCEAKIFLERLGITA